MGRVPWCVALCSTRHRDNDPYFVVAGQDNPSTQCIVGDVPEVWDGDESDHDGPYDGVTMGC